MIYVPWLDEIFVEIVNYLAVGEKEINVGRTISTEFTKRTDV